MMENEKDYLRKTGQLIDDIADRIEVKDIDLKNAYEYNQKLVKKGLKEDIFRLSEDKYIDEIKDYIVNTYKEHYSNGDGKQIIEDIIDDGFGVGFALGNMRKYAARYGKKNGYNRKDLMKIIHYGIFALISHDREHNEIK